MIQNWKEKAEGKKGGLMVLIKLILDMNQLLVYKVNKNLRLYNKVKKNLSCRKTNLLCKN